MKKKEGSGGKGRSEGVTREGRSGVSRKKEMQREGVGRICDGCAGGGKKHG